MEHTINELPDIKHNHGPARTLRTNQPLTRANLETVLGWMDLTLRFNMMTNADEFWVDGAPVDEYDQADTLLALVDYLKRLDITGQADLRSMLTTVAARDRYHPMEDWMQATPWDGVDRIEQLAATITTNSELWPVYLENWLVQSVAAVCGWRDGPQSLPHVLVLVGGQGLGKSHWLRQLGAGWIKCEAELHLGSPAGKDHQIEALRYPMVELAELDGIFRKSDISHMKSFISRDVDSIRLPYGRTAIKRPRVTTFSASVNEAEFLNDPSGSRRFWPVQVESIDWEASNVIDWTQLWAQAYSFYLENSDFNLTAEEDELRATVAIEQHTAVSVEVEYLTGFWEAHKHLDGDFQAMNGAEILRMLGYRNPWNKTVGEAKKWLTDNVGKPRTLSGKQRAWMFPFSNFGSDPSVWPKPIKIKSVK